MKKEYEIEFYKELANEIKPQGFKCFLYNEDTSAWLYIITPNNSWLYIDNGEYKITLLVPDNKDKTRAWFSNKIDISNLEKGTYAIYIHTIANVDDASELNDIFARSINSKMTICVV